MTYADFQTYLKRRPFQPFLVGLNDGETFPVRHPEFIKVTLTSVFIFKPLDDDANVLEGLQVVCAMQNISRLEPLHVEPAGKS